MPFQRRLLSILVCGVLFCAGSAGATQTFVIDSASSSLAIENARFEKIPPTFLSTLEPLAPDDWVRSLAGTFTADETTGALESASFQILGAPLAGDQIRLDSRGNPRDLGDIELAGLAISVGPTGDATFTAGTIDFDLSLGDTRISSPTPFSLVGVTSTTTNMGTPIVNGMQVTIPILLQFEDVQVYINGNASFDLVGTIQGTVVPEPSTGLTLTLGLIALAARRHARRLRRSLMFRLSRRNLVMLFAATLATAACGIGNTVSTSLPPVEAMDDEATTPMNTPVDIFVLANDLQDDDLVTDLDDPVDQDMNVQVGAVEIDILSFPEKLIYTPPTDFVGTVTFDYDITALGTLYDYTSTDTATVTVTVCDICPADAMDDDVETLVDQPVTIDVLMNDVQDADLIDEFEIDALDDMDELQLDSVSLLETVNERDQLIYTPPPDFEGRVTFSYTIVGVGDTVVLDSEDTAIVTVDVDPAPPAFPIVQFQEASTITEGEGVLFSVAQNASDGNPDTFDAFVFFGEVTACMDVSPGDNVPVEARIFADGVIVVDGACPQFRANMEYTIRLQPSQGGGGPPLEIVCVDGLATPCE